MSKKHFKGSFTYHLEDENEKVIDVIVPFDMNVSIENNILSGTRVDQETQNLITEPIHVNGFIEDYLISFRIDYPYNYYIDENGEPVIEKDIRHPGVNYVGSLNKITKDYEGEWYIILDVETITPLQEDYIEATLNGTWTMKEV